MSGSRESRLEVQAPPLTEESVEAELVRRAGQGDAAAFRMLIGRHLPRVVGIARRMLGEQAEAEDVAQETFLRLWRSAASIEVGDTGVKAWLVKVASNLCIDRVRARARVTVTDAVPDVADAPQQLRSIQDEDLRMRVHEALQKLPERQRLALTLFHYEDMSQIEVGRVMGISDEAVESLLARARRQLKTELKAEWNGLIDDNGNMV